MFNNSQSNLAVFFDNTFNDLKTLSKGVIAKNLYALEKDSNPFHFIQEVLNDQRGNGEK